MESINIIIYTGGKDSSLLSSNRILWFHDFNNFITNVNRLQLFAIIKLYERIHTLAKTTISDNYIDCFYEIQ